MALPARCDVLVVGAGPVGMTLGAELLRQKAGSVLVIDRQAEGANESRAAVIHARTLEVLEGLGVTDRLIARGLRIADFRLRDRDRVLLTMNFDGIPSAYRFALLCPQNVTEDVLQARLAELGGSIERPWALQALDPHEDHIVARIGNGDAAHDVQARWVVGCDGSRSFVREAAGIAFEGGSYAESFVLADVHLRWPIGRHEVSLLLSPDGMVLVAPLPGDHYRIVATVREQPPAEPSRDFVQAILDQRGPIAAPAVVEDVVWSSRFRIHHRVAARFRQGRILLCGDAAHVHSPAGGQGMNTGIQDAASLAASLAEALRSGDLAALDSWAEQRRANARRVVRLTDRMTRAATASSLPARTLRRLALGIASHLPPLRQRMAVSIAELDLR
jgi:2-polyprenyl-6-methoxyphenol hydroxylase-like FAD-dependent oxidoreductase